MRSGDAGEDGDDESPVEGSADGGVAEERGEGSRLDGEDDDVGASDAGSVVTLEDRKGVGTQRR